MKVILIVFLIISCLLVIVGALAIAYKLRCKLPATPSDSFSGLFTGCDCKGPSTEGSGDSCRCSEKYVYSKDQTACIPCGANNTACCANSICDPHNVCDSKGLCNTCGLIEGQPCCANSACAPLSLACDKETCEKCGGRGQICCVGDQCNDMNDLCNPNTQHCEECGVNYGEVCCPNHICTGAGMRCDSDFCTCIYGYVLDSQTNKCVPCGTTGSKCCSGARPCDDPGSDCNSAGKCGKCGVKYGEACCLKGTCSADHNLNCTPGQSGASLCYCSDAYVFNASENKCVPCGAQGHMCCTGSLCDDKNDFCNSEGLCGGCGLNEGNPCCSQNECRDPSLACDKETCEKCGGRGQICCNGDSCNDMNDLCDPNTQHCEECGVKYGEVCCSNHICTGAGMRCDSGFCTCIYGYVLDSQTNKCVPCGKTGSKCCSGDHPCDDPGTDCNPAGKCEKCGVKYGEACCLKGTCSADHNLNCTPGQSGASLCYCSDGYVLNSAENACIKK
jgi:hypothetical protein